MKVVVYSTGSAEGQLKWVNKFRAIPSLNEQWKRIRANFPGYSFSIVASQRAIPHLVDYTEDKQEIAPEGVHLVLLPPSASTDDYVEAIRNEAPSIVIAASSFGGLIDWETVRDAMIADELSRRGIRAVSNSLYAAEVFFDKWNTHRVLTEKGFPVARAVHIPLVYLALRKTHPELYSNVYLDLAFSRIRQFHYPVVIKESAGSGSAGLSVAGSFEEAREAILARQDAVDLIVEEMISGEQFGTEIHGTRGNYTILPPFHFNLDQRGITDARNNYKFGPVTNPKYRVEELRAMLRRLAEEMHIEGCAQVDLAFTGDHWVIIEVNPRMSGMTAVTAACESRYPLEVVIESCLDSKINYDEPDILEKCFFFRGIIHSEDALFAMQDEPHVKYLELGYPVTGLDLVIAGATVVLGGFAKYAEMAREVARLHDVYPEVIGDQVLETARRIAAEHPEE